MTRRRRRRRHTRAAWCAAIAVIAVIVPGAAGPRILAAAAAVVVGAGPALVARRVPDRLLTRSARAGLRHDQPRPAIPAKLRRRIYAADRYRCVACKAKGRPARLQIDHFIPYAWGGLTSLWNCFTLCAACNRVKCDYWELDGKARGRPRGTAKAARKVIRAELRARRNPLRWIRLTATR